MSIRQRGSNLVLPDGYVWASVIITIISIGLLSFYNPKFVLLARIFADISPVGDGRWLGLLGAGLFGCLFFTCLYFVFYTFLIGVESAGWISQWIAAKRIMAIYFVLFILVGFFKPTIHEIVKIIWIIFISFGLFMLRNLFRNEATELARLGEKEEEPTFGSLVEKYSPHNDSRNQPGRNTVQDDWTSDPIRERERHDDSHFEDGDEAVQLGSNGRDVSEVDHDSSLVSDDSISDDSGPADDGGGADGAADGGDGGDGGGDD